jgi:hypothetical protein
MRKGIVFNWNEYFHYAHFSHRRNWRKFVSVLLLQIGRQSDRQRAKRRLQINGATPRKGDEALAMAADAVEEEELQKRNRYKTSDYSSEEGEGVAYQIYKKAGDWWKCVFLHAGDELLFAFHILKGIHICLY